MKNRRKVLRVALNLSQAELADKLGVARRTIYAMEAGPHGASLTLACRVAQTLGVRIEEASARPAET